MDRIPLEVIIRHASREVGKFISEQVEERRMSGYVPVIIEAFTTTYYYLKCDIHGYPIHYQTSFATFDSGSLMAIKQGDSSQFSTMTVEETNIYLDKPLLMQRMDWENKPYVFLWSGKILSRSKIPLEKLNVSELMKLAQTAIANREGLVIDEAFKNKIYK